ncbi:hypothetical protein SYNPS1DRAFT_27230 [Syncephalis pseudoplumigaleata]|uniref:WD40-repeat-containing domain protein n=1 Tax=Syncephalis pseudoplumigaleata TaxID=1712513 RepID=A0A4P9Z3H8_9FUNG|nr:hypothetical protein SYNPS1DRAFT_27230 [Syncephalis pseudoplumigaleata]|eukprot:RKP27103.1 hypothetical protein SYNPS1DRAFT_27230 [Syncephalis pseudoplumigaleata]
MTTAYFYYYDYGDHHRQPPPSSLSSYTTCALGRAIATFESWGSRGIAAAAPSSSSSSDMPLPWQALFAWIVRRERNWHRCRSASHTVLRVVHRERVQQIMLLPNELMLTSSFDRSMMIWRLSAEAGATEWLRWECDCVVSLDALLLDADEGQPWLVIITSHFDRFALRGHMAPIKQVRISRRYAASYGDIAELFLWNWENGQSLYRFNVGAWMVTDILLTPAPHDLVVLACQTGALRGITVSKYPSMDALQEPAVEELQPPTPSMMSPSIRLRWLISGEVTDYCEGPAVLKLARITEQQTEILVLQPPSDQHHPAAWSLASLGTIETTLSIHFPLAVTERRVVTVIPYGAILQSLSAFDTATAAAAAAAAAVSVDDNDIARPYRLDWLFASMDQQRNRHRRSSSSSSASALFVDTMDSSNLWKFILIRQSDLEGKRVVSLAMDANRLVVGCIDGTIFIYQFASQSALAALDRRALDEA